MNYVAFEGISQMDNLYTQSVLKMKAKELIDDEDKKKKALQLLSYNHWEDKKND